jgi:hypothetical protein
MKKVITTKNVNKFSEVGSILACARAPSCYYDENKEEGMHLMHTSKNYVLSFLWWYPRTHGAVLWW